MTRHRHRSRRATTPARRGAVLANWFAGLLLALAAGVFGSAPAVAAVWAVTAQWNDDAERRYSEWVAQSYVPTLFYQDSPYADFATDCADAAYAMRMIFAFENGLPFMIADPERPGRTLSQATKRFDHLRPGLPRFRGFLEWMAAHTSTATLADDTYPISIDREQIRPGVIFLAWRRHVVQVVEVRPTGLIRYLESTTPRTVRVMTSIVGFPHQVPADPKGRRHGDGFRRFKWPEHYGRAEAGLPGFGTEQFERAQALGREALPFHDWLRQRLALTDESPSQRARRQLFTLCQMAWDRATVIDEAQQALNAMRRAGRRCMGPSDHDAYSTNGRDDALRRAFERTVAHAESPQWEQVDGRFRDFVELMLGRLPEADVARVGPDLLKWCDVNRVEGGPGRSMHLADLYALTREGRLVPDPHALPAQRWGLAAHTASCPAPR
jgi:hypothetical protein